MPTPLRCPTSLQNTMINMLTFSIPHRNTTMLQTCRAIRKRRAFKAMLRLANFEDAPC